MQAINKRELNQHTAAVLARVTDTDDVVVTERGTPRWRVSTVREQDTALVRLEREGRYTPPASTPAPWPSHPGGRAYAEGEVDALLDEMRGNH
ncbi:type II toxin-antitoxin system prevent-host-death family antitoxin [Brachybacterium fresconis]|uniref:Prevent-host-death family protein n=1 Tax=Brachybacterium fresconis TaxID=173363 RepID=A0ABS4YI78_9MICO|nr:type II toxin-antitoxin system prevent-host-death family antitoxin [Brachybacterium fresconis]MBP2408449.1 prevent-host-death family protein [Brachybacterium fresconis]